MYYAIIPGLLERQTSGHEQKKFFVINRHVEQGAAPTTKLVKGWSMTKYEEETISPPVDLVSLTSSVLLAAFFILLSSLKNLKNTFYLSLFFKEL